MFKSSNQGYYKSYYNASYSFKKLNKDMEDRKKPPQQTKTLIKLLDMKTTTFEKT